MDVSDLVMLLAVLLLALMAVPLLAPIHAKVKEWFHDNPVNDFTD